MQIELTDAREESIPVGDDEFCCAAVPVGVDDSIAVVDEVGDRYGDDEQVVGLMVHRIVDAADDR